MENLVDDEIMRGIISANLIKYRKANNLTQMELSEKLQYSDKNISKWERGESLPDIVILNKLANIYGITVNDFLTENENVKPSEELTSKKHKFLDKKQLLIISLSVGIVWLVATILFGVFHIFYLSDAWPMWQLFIIAVPISFVVMLVFSSMWCTNLMNCIVVTLLIWSMAVTFDICVPLPNTFIIYIIAIPVQILDFLWFALKKINKIQKSKE